MAEEQTPRAPLPEARRVAGRQRGFSIVWIIPIVAAIAGAWVAVTRVMSEGPKITITFNSAEGLEAGKTKIQYKGVEVGTLTTIQLSNDHRLVIATAQMEPKTEDFLVEDTKFWVVRPRISGATVTGLGTLISGAYLGMEIGNSKRERRTFVALETPPVITGGAPGRFFTLKTTDLGSLDTGTPVFFRRLQVGRVASYQLDRDGRLFTLKIFVRAPYEQFVTPNTRFWQASGIDVNLSASGITVQTQSILSILIGGIAFETPENPVMPVAAADTTFTLYENRRQAFEPPARYPQTYQLIFNESVRGLAPGAPVDFRGIQIGEVAEVRAQVDLKTMEFSVPVTIRLDPQRLGVKVVSNYSAANLDAMRRRLIDSLVTHGVRAQLRTGNLLTGSVYVAFDFFPGAPSEAIDWSQSPVRLPTIPGQLQATEASIQNIINKLDKMPLQQIGDNLRQTLADLDVTLTAARGTISSAHTAIDNANNFVEPNSFQSQELDATLQEVSRAARSVRVLADYLDRHPEALIRGKPGGTK